VGEARPEAHRAHPHDPRHPDRVLTAGLDPRGAMRRPHGARRAPAAAWWATSARSPWRTPGRQPGRSA